MYQITQNPTAASHPHRSESSSIAVENPPNVPLTPLIQISVGAERVLAKQEYLLGKTASVKDRVVGFMIDAAIQRGELQAGGKVVEASSGSTAIAAAAECSSRGLRFFAVVPASVPVEKIRLIELLGGQVRTVAPEGGIAAASDKANEIAEDEGAWLMNQFQNTDHRLAHHATALELVRQLGDAQRPIALCTGVGTGATLTGIYECLTNRGAEVLPVVARVDARTPMFQDIGFVSAGFDNLLAQLSKDDDSFRRSVREITVPESNASEILQKLWKSGLLVGPASAVNCAVAGLVARELGPSYDVVTVFTDRVERYLTRKLVN